MADNLPLLISDLLDPRCYPHPASEVLLIQTHISWVLLAGDYAYKIKKPVRLPFLDFSSLDLRRTCCEEELRLNRRYAPELYLAVWPICRNPDGRPVMGSDSGTPIEFAVRMQRFDPNMQLDHVCQRGELQPDHVLDLASTITRFHALAARVDARSHLGQPKLILAQALDNFLALEPALPAALPQQQLHALRQWTEQTFRQVEARMHLRRQTGFIRECHGDLHLGNLVLIDQHVQMFDGIEFCDELRWIDLASEWAFPYMDLLSHGQPGLANWFINACVSQGGDFEAVPLLRFYAVYRALVRAKVAAIRQAQNATPSGEVSRFMALALELSSPPKPRLIITHGLSGCGKTVITHQLLQSAHAHPMLRLRSDLERKRLFGLQPSDHSGTRSLLYNPHAHERTYARLQQLSEMVLRAGWSVVVDATFLRRTDRTVFQELARRMGIGYAIVAPQATLDQLQQRLLARAASGQDASDADLQVLEAQRHSIEPLDAQEQSFVMDLDALTRPVPQAMP